MNKKTSLVITSISKPNPVLRSFAEGSRDNGVRFIVIGDQKSPPDFNIPDCEFWGLESQRELPFSITKMLPERHYGRKNIGYLLAIQGGSEVIIESDDDNFPRPDFWEDRIPRLMTNSVNGESWVNMYRYFSGKNIWPRGFPLELVRDGVPNLSSPEERHCPIQQGLADENPDVDAIYRLTNELPVAFDKREFPVSLGRGSWCPFNSQNTTWFRESFPLMYLPSYCSFRMTDIWRSYVAVRICWENDWDVLFHNATVWQERNEHNLMKDFSDEVVGYMNNREICERLSRIELKRGREYIGENMIKCYMEFIKMGLIGEEEMPLLKAWLSDLDTLNHPLILELML